MLVLTRDVGRDGKDGVELRLGNRVIGRIVLLDVRGSNGMHEGRAKLGFDMHPGIVVLRDDIKDVREPRERSTEEEGEQEAASPSPQARPSARGGITWVKQA